MADELSSDALELLERIRTLANPRYVDALALLRRHDRAQAALAELAAAELVEHRNNGQLAYRGPSRLEHRRREAERIVRSTDAADT